jgi:hypothetical protein
MQLAAVTQFKVIAGPVENYSARSLRAAGFPRDWITAAYHRQLDRIRGEKLHPWLDPDGAAPKARTQYSRWLDEQWRNEQEAER